jgi:uncharacterized protein YcbX
MTMRVAALWRYPVKSLGGQSLDRAMVEPRGLAGDRRWMVITPDGRFVTRREVPVMAHITADPVGDGLRLRHRDGAILPVVVPTAAPDRAVRVWSDTVAGADAGDAAAAWLSDHLGRAVRLVHMPDSVVRAVDPRYARGGDQVGFADGFPLLVTTTASLDALNRELAQPLTMARFRPNLVISGAPAAFAEADWLTLRIGAISLRVVKPCTRCVITTQDPDSGAVIDRHEPLRTLRALGQVFGPRGEAVFGQNAIPDGTGPIAVGDAVAVIEQRPA